MRWACSPRPGSQQGDVTIVNISPAELVTALQNKDVDAIVIWEPWGSLAVAKVQGAVRIIAGDCKTVYDPGTVLTTKSIVGSDKRSSSASRSPSSRRSSG